MIEPYPTHHRPPHIEPQEWELRVRLAAAYRVVDMLGWSEVIMNHISVRVPGAETHFLINPYGLHYAEVTASNLLKIDTNGRKVAPSDYQPGRLRDPFRDPRGAP
jgi:ribulose-5-phosphate 4-epimerase/fuculose-1-phosphate aldolase